MKQSKYSEAQIIGILNQSESGVPVADQNLNRADQFPDEPANLG